MCSYRSYTHLEWDEVCCISQVMQVGFELIAGIGIRLFTRFGFGLLYWDGEPLKGFLVFDDSECVGKSLAFDSAGVLHRSTVS